MKILLDKIPTFLYNFPVAETKILDGYDKKSLLEASRLLTSGEVVAFPTETVYGLAANALNGEAVKKIFEAKGRPQDNPLIVHISAFKMVEEIAEEITPAAAILMEKFWPGPLTVILAKKKSLPDEVTAGLDSVAIRFPSNKVATDLIDLCGFPLAAPSANVSGRPSPTRADHVFGDMNGKIPLILDGGECSVGLESTVVDCRFPEVFILRPGKISREEIAAIVPLGEKIVGENEGPRSPGMKYRHYAPQGEVRLFSEDEIRDLHRRFEAGFQGKKVGILALDEVLSNLGNLEGVKKISLGKTYEDAASKIFAGLRLCDEEGMDEIFVQKFHKEGIGEALMNRLEKAATKQ